MRSERTVKKIPEICKPELLRRHEVGTLDEKQLECLWVYVGEVLVVFSCGDGTLAGSRY